MRKTKVVHVLAGITLLISTPLVPSQVSASSSTSQKAPPNSVRGPFVGQVVQPSVFNGDLRTLPQLPHTAAPKEIPLGRTPAEKTAHPGHHTHETQPQTSPNGQMPDPIITFEGLDFSNFGAGWPPDTNGDVGPQYYLQFVNTSFGIYNKTTGERVAAMTIDSLWAAARTGTLCDTSNAGDGVILYDYIADRWLVTDFTFNDAPGGGPNYECIAISQTGDPVSGGWYFYAPQTDPGVAFPDYPKLSVWPDAYYMTDNMFGNEGGFWVRAFAFDRTSMLAGQAMRMQYFDTCLAAECDSLLSSNVRGRQPPTGSPAYFMSAVIPDTLKLWEFHVDWDQPANSRFTLTTQMTVPSFDVAPSVNQKDSPIDLDTLSPRLMFMLQYRNYGDHESLFANHSIGVNDLAVPRWYEIRDPGGSPYVYQQGTLNPGDGENRWMGSIAADRQGNVALGYSIASEDLYASIRYSGRRDGEILNELPQAEASLYEGTGSQTGSAGYRWGDYSAMTVDQDDDCTFWYTTEYLRYVNPVWYTRIGSFKFAACGANLGIITGRVRDANTGQGIAGVPVTLQGNAESLTVPTNENGTYRIAILPGLYDITAGPLLPGYPNTGTEDNVASVAGQTVLAPAIDLTPVPAFTFQSSTVNDLPPYGNGNSYPEPGEGFLLSTSVTNIGATTATNVRSRLVSLTPGVRVVRATTRYPNIPAGQSVTTPSPFRVQVASTVPCGTMLQFRQDIRSAEGTYSVTFSLKASVPQPLASVLDDNVEHGMFGWTTGGTLNTWAITTETAHSPTHSWSDSPNANYPDNADNWLQSPALNLSGKSDIQVSGWYSYSLESGYDYVYLEYSLDGGQTWNTDDPLTQINGHVQSWQNIAVNAPQLENQANVRLRYHFVSDAGVNFDGIHIDDVSVSYEPTVCTPPEGTGAPAR